MRYFVINPDGQRYGPADLATLQQWANEGRVVATTALEEEATGTRTQASAVPGLMLGGGQPPNANPYAAPSNPYSAGTPYGDASQQNQGNPYAQSGGYYRPSAQPGYNSAYDPMIQKEINNAWIGGAVGLVCCGPFAIWGLVCANKARAAGHPGAQAPYIFNIVAIVIWVLLFIFRVGVIGSSF